MTIYLIRHGKTEANERHLYCGSTDLPLSDVGRAELEKLSYNIKNVRFITSGMKRTNETLRILFGDVPYEEDPRLREVDFGITGTSTKKRDDFNRMIRKCKKKSKYALSERLVCGECGTLYRRCTWTIRGKRRLCGAV